MNIKAAFLHNVTDALASVGVIIAGALILLYGWVWTDAAMTLLISGYVLYQGFTETPKVIHLLMEGAPKGLNMQNVTSVMEAVEGVLNVHHVHVWQLDEHRNALEAHVVLEKDTDMDALKRCLKKLLQDKFEIEHSTLEFENNTCSSHSDPKNV
jgi:cobalt-zinc-cadmium efflux system protein